MQNYFFFWFGYQLGCTIIADVQVKERSKQPTPRSQPDASQGRQLRCLHHKRLSLKEQYHFDGLLFDEK